jgi:translation initiation factor 1
VREDRVAMSKRGKPDPEPSVPFHNPFGGLADRLGMKPEPSPPTSGGAVPTRGPARAVVRLERRGRGGKEATIVEKLDLPPAALAGWLRELKRALGCGGAVEGDALALQGDLRGRVRAFLEERGVRRVTLG